MQDQRHARTINPGACFRLQITRAKGLQSTLQGFTRGGLQPEILADQLLETQALPALKKTETKPSINIANQN
eukprot:850593-Pelagomonas_calceolata.AAC.1